ncbi:MAG: DNA polymerase I [Halanaerobacter sp.]
MEKENLYLLDGNSLTYRAFYALPESLTKSDGTVTNAVYGFTRMLISLVNNNKVDCLGVAFDLAAPTFRHEEYDDYKGNRKETPDTLKPQFGMVKDVLDSLDVPTFEKEGFEADDLIGTLAQKAEEEGYHVTIVTGDRDNLQLISDNIDVMYTRKGISDIIDYDLEKFREEYELEPLQLVDKKGLMGDSSDNIPGVDGIGKKTSTKLLKEFGDLETVLDNIDQVGGKKRKARLREQADRARMSKKLAKIKVDIPLAVDFADLSLSDWKTDKAQEVFTDLEFNSLIAEIGGHNELEECEYEELDDINELKDLDLASRIAVNLDLSGEKLEQELNGLALSTGEKNYYLELSGEDLEQLEDLLAHKKLLILDPKDQFRYLLEQGIEWGKLVFEPLLADYLLHPSDDETDFEDVIENHLQLALPEVDETEELVLKTNTLFELREELTAKLEEQEMLELYRDIELPLVKILAQLELNGVKVSPNKLEELGAELEEKIREIEEEAYELAGEEFNLNSPQQLGNILFEKLGLPVIKKTKTGYSTSAKVLEKLEGQHDIIPLISKYRTYQKLNSTYVSPLEDYINPETGRIHTTYNQRVTATGRLSSTEPNLQNIPIRSEEGRRIRKVFVAEKGQKLLAADYSQVELRILAHISQDEGLKAAYQEGADIHTKTAQELFGLSTSETRRKAKAVNFGIAYGISAWGLADRLEINQQEAQEYIDLYFERYPKVEEYIEEQKTKAKERGYVETIFKRRRYLPEITSSNYHRRQFAERMAINTPIQGSGADIMKIAMIDVYNALKESKLDADILLQVHDELVLEVPEDEVKDTAELVQEMMEAAADLDVALDVDLKVGDNWNEMEGMKSSN